MMRLFIALIVIVTALPAQAGRHSIQGQVLDRNGVAVNQAIITLKPGNVQLVSDAEGRFLIDYLRDENGERTKLDKRTNYVVEIFKPGFHIKTRDFYFKRGAVLLEHLTLLEETLRVKDDERNLDPEIFHDPTHSSGANYEGQ